MNKKEIDQQLIRLRDEIAAGRISPILSPFRPLPTRLTWAILHDIDPRLVSKN